MVGDPMQALIGSLPSVLGLASGVILFLIALVQGLMRAPDLITPTTYQTEQTTAHPVRVGEFEPDLAWPFYPFRQARADLARVRADLGGRYGKLAKWPLDTFFRGRHGSRFWWWFFFPIPVVTLSWLLTTGLTALACFAVFAAVNVVCACSDRRGPRCSVRAGPRDGAGPARPLHAEASCPHCYHVMPWPAYRCPACSKLHRDLRPGQLGLFARRCDCGTLLPTMVLRAAWRLPAVCQKCAKPLRAGSGALRDIRILIFGDTSAGKTRFLYAGAGQPGQTTGRAPIPIGFPDDESRARRPWAWTSSGPDGTR